MNIPLEYLLETSRNILGEYQLSRLNRADLLKKEIREKQEKLLDNLAEAYFAMWLREHREELIKRLAALEAPRE